MFSKPPLRLVEAQEWSLTANRNASELAATRLRQARWVPLLSTAEEEATLPRDVFDSSSKTNPLLSVALQPMEVRTFIVRFGQ
jgi:hypothetical protein